LNDHSPKRALALEELKEEFSEPEFEEESDDIDGYEFTISMNGGYEISGGQSQDDLPEQDGSAVNATALDEEMPEYPFWQGETLVVPPQWEGELSDVKFFARSHAEGIVLIAEIPGQTTSVISALCSDDGGFMDAYLAIDAAIAVATEPESVPKEFLEQNSMLLQAAVSMFKFAAGNLDTAMDEIFQPPDRAKQYQAQLRLNANGSRTLRDACDRIDAAMKSHIAPALHAASVMTMRDQTIH